MSTNLCVNLWFSSTLPGTCIYPISNLSYNPTPRQPLIQKTTFQKKHPNALHETGFGVTPTNHIVWMALAFENPKPVALTMTWKKMTWNYSYSTSTNELNLFWLPSWVVPGTGIKLNPLKFRYLFSIPWHLPLDTTSSYAPASSSSWIPRHWIDQWDVAKWPSLESFGGVANACQGDSHAVSTHL